MKNILYEGYLGPRLPREVQLKRVQRVIREELTELQRYTLIAYYFQDKTVPDQWESQILARILSMGTKGKPDGRDERDNANYDMYLDRARELNLRITTLPDVFYFSVPCSAAEKQPDGTFLPARGMEPLFVARSRQIGAYSGRTAGGMAVDESWRENDGLVNTVSAMVPTGAPSKPLNRENAERGMWNVFPVVRGDHMWLQGGLMHRHDIRLFYLDLLTMISGLKTPV